MHTQPVGHLLHERVNMQNTILTVMLLLPSMAFGATNCRVVEFKDHYEAICIGDPRFVDQRQPEKPEQVAPTTANPSGIGIRSRRAQKLEAVRSLGSQRYNTAVDASATGAATEAGK
jgi:hypothetical protein